MSSAHIKALDEHSYLVSGELNMATVPDLLSAIQATLSQANQVVCYDLSGIERSDSAGLALLVELMQQAQQNNHPIRFRHLPAQMLEIARVSGLDEILPLD